MPDGATCQTARRARRRQVPNGAKGLRRREVPNGAKSLTAQGNKSAPLPTLVFPPQLPCAVWHLALLGTWGLVAVQTARGSVGGSLFTPAPTAGPIKAKKDPPRED